MKKKIVLLPVLLFTILTTSCNSKEEKKKKDMPEWLNHPHEVLRYAEDAWPKVKMSNHKLTCFDDDLKIRDSIMAISYADFISKDETIEKSKEYVKYTLCYGDEINDVMADLTIYDNGSLFLNDCNDHHYYFNIALENVKVIFDTTEQEIKKVEEQKNKKLKRLKNKILTLKSKRKKTAQLLVMLKTVRPLTRHVMQKTSLNTILVNMETIVLSNSLMLLMTTKVWYLMKSLNLNLKRKIPSMKRILNT